MKTLAFYTHTVCLALVAGCPAKPTSTENSTTDATASSGEAGTGSTDTGEVPTGSSTNGDEPPPPDGGIADGECDPWEQDCPNGYKCMAFAPEGEDFFTGNKCTPVVENPRSRGDSCTVVDGWWSGFDDCDYGLACWDINHANNTGLCRALCTGSADAPECPEDGDVCAFWVPGIAHVCLETCDPLLQDCNAGSACGPEWSSNAAEWVCLAEYSGVEGQQFDNCFASNDCDPGLMCWDPSKATECAGAEVGCCLSLCDLSAPECNGMGAVCTSFYDEIEGQASPEFENVGLCVLPG